MPLNYFKAIKAGQNIYETDKLIYLIFNIININIKAVFPLEVYPWQ